MPSNMKKQLTASEMGVRSWEVRQKKYTPEQLTQMMSKNGKKGGKAKNKRKLSTPSIDSKSNVC